MTARTKRARPLSGAELARAVAEFDREFVADTFGAPSAEARARLSRAKRGRGRPVRGKGVRVISVSVERTLLERFDALASRMDVTRSELIACGLRAVLAADGDR